MDPWIRKSAVHRRQPVRVLRTAAAADVDEDPPEITHEQLGTQLFGQAALVQATVIDLESEIGEVKVFYRRNDVTTWSELALSSAGDVDGDGLVDLVIGRPGSAVGGAEAGAATLLYGPAAGGGLLGVEGLNLYGAAAGQRLGAAVAGLGDLDGDGHGELGLGAPGDDTAGADAGAALLWFGLGI